LGKDLAGVRMIFRAKRGKSNPVHKDFKKAVSVKPRRLFHLEARQIYLPELTNEKADSREADGRLT